MKFKVGDVFKHSLDYPELNNLRFTIKEINENRVYFEEIAENGKNYSIAIVNMKDLVKVSKLEQVLK